MRGPAPAPPRFIALGFPERVIMRCVRVLVQKKSDAVDITLSANLCTGARVAPPRCPVFRYSQKQFHDTITARICQAANWPPIMTLTGRELRPCWPWIRAICRQIAGLNCRGRDGGPGLPPRRASRAIISGQMLLSRRRWKLSEYERCLLTLTM